MIVAVVLCMWMLVLMVTVSLFRSVVPVQGKQFPSRSGVGRKLGPPAPNRYYLVNYGVILCIHLLN